MLYVSPYRVRITPWKDFSTIDTELKLKLMLLLLLRSVLSRPARPAVITIAAIEVGVGASIDGLLKIEAIADY